MGTDKIINAICEASVKKLDNLLIKGLALKGYTFTDNQKLKTFIVEKCNATSIQNTPYITETTYYVNGTPFLFLVEDRSLPSVSHFKSSIEINTKYSFL